MTEDDYTKVRRWFDRGEISDGLRQLLLNHHPQSRCEVAAALKSSHNPTAPVTAFAFERRPLQSHNDLYRPVTGETTADFYDM